LVVCSKARLFQTGSINTIVGKLRLLLFLASPTSRQSSHPPFDSSRAGTRTYTHPPGTGICFPEACVLLAGSDFLHPLTAFIALNPAAAAALPLNKTKLAQYALPRLTQATAHCPEVHVPSSIIAIAYCGPSGSCATVTSLRASQLRGTCMHRSTSGLGCDQIRKFASADRLSRACVSFRVHSSLARMMDSSTVLCT
jgi:hypothetical protein